MDGNEPFMLFPTATTKVQNQDLTNITKRATAGHIRSSICVPRRVRSLADDSISKIEMCCLGSLSLEVRAWTRPKDAWRGRVLLRVAPKSIETLKS